MRRFVVFDRGGSPLFDLDGRIESCVRTEVLNGEHKLDVVTTQPLEEGMRILVRDGTGRWREWVVDETDEAHEGGRTTVGTYGCTWSMQYDLATEEGGELWPGTYDPISAAAALSMVLGSDSTWEVGNVTVAGLNSTSLYDGSRWEYLSKLLDTWGGEMEPRIVVDANGVTHRYVDWLAHVGSEVATRRYDYGGDCDAIRRKGAPGPRYCRIVPRGGRDATDNDGVKYSERCGVEEEPYQADSTGEFVHPANADYIEDTVASLDFRVPDGHGGWRYPTKVVCYDLDYAGDQEELLAKAMEDAPNHTRPKATYEVSVRQYAPAGTDPHGTQLGDEVHVVDATFGEAPLRIEARVVEVQVNELDEADAHLTIGECRQTMASAFKSLRSAIDAAEERTRRIEGAGTLVYLQTLLEQLNEEINATGGYAYLAQGEGIIVYDIAVDDPLVGYNSATQTWASQVVQIKGGNIRIANEKNASFAGINDWKWKTLLVSGHIAAELVTAAQIVAGYIGNASMGSYWDLDNDVLHIGTTSIIDNTTVADLLQDVASAGISSIQYGTSASSATEPTSWSTTAPTSVAKGSWLWIRTTYKNGTTSTTKAYAGTDGQNGQDGADGSDGQDGADGIGITSVTPQYYLSTSSSSATGGSWSNSPPTWSANTYIWTRSLITWDTTPSTTSTTTEVYDAALTQANQQAAQAVSDAAEAAKTATNYLTFNQQDGLDVGYSGTSAKTRVSGSGVEVFDGNGASALFAGISDSNSIVRIGKASGSGNVVMSSEGYVDVRNASTIMAHFGYGEGTNASGGISIAPYYDIGVRKSGTTVGNYSIAEGRYSTASKYCSHAEGQSTTASEYCSHAEGDSTTASEEASHAEGRSTTASGIASHAEGYSTTASGRHSHAEGYRPTASGKYSHAEGDGTTASGEASHAEGYKTKAVSSYSHAEGYLTEARRSYQHVCGVHNVTNLYHLLIVGNGSTSETGSASNAMYLSYEGNLWIAGTLTQNSDRRLKDHHAYLGEDACDFIRALKPALYTKDGARHVGFYAQDVQDAEPDGWDTETVTAQHTDESLDFDPLTLDYTAIIAPLVAYAQGLERRIDQQQKQIDELTERIKKLEGRR